MNPSKDPLVKSLRKVNREHKKTVEGRLKALYRKRSLYRRRMTLAQSNLTEINCHIEALLLACCRDHLSGPVPELQGSDYR